MKKFRYKGVVVHFVRTYLPLKMKRRIVMGAVYQALEEPEYFYVVNGDAMLKLDTQWAYSPGVGGFSMHSAIVETVYCLPHIRWRRAVSFQFARAKGTSYVEGARLRQVQEMLLARNSPPTPD